MFTSVKQLERYEKKRNRKSRFSLYLSFIEIAVFITVFYIVLEIAYKLSGII